MKNSIQKNMTALYGELAGSVKGLGHVVELGNDLLRAQHALQMAIDTLGIVKTIFLNNRHYWIQVTHNAKQQGSSGDTSVVMKVRTSCNTYGDIETNKMFPGTNPRNA